MCSISGIPGNWIEIPIPDIRLWTCETPYLYFFTVTMGEDFAESYFAMRKFSVEKDEKGNPAYLSERKSTLPERLFWIRDTGRTVCIRRRRTRQ